MSSFNKVFLMGNLTRNPELNYLPSQTAVVNFGLAVNRKNKDKDETLFIDCTAFAGQAENINKYLKKGSSVFIEGRLSKDQWTAQDGTKKEKFKVVVLNAQFLGGTNGASRTKSKEKTLDDEMPF